MVGIPLCAHSFRTAIKLSSPSESVFAVVFIRDARVCIGSATPNRLRKLRITLEPGFPPCFSESLPYQLIGRSCVNGRKTNGEINSRGPCPAIPSRTVLAADAVEDLPTALEMGVPDVRLELSERVVLLADIFPQQAANPLGVHRPALPAQFRRDTGPPVARPLQGDAMDGVT